MISNTIKIRPRYSEVDKMGYVYHANYITYCHQARTELMRKLGVCDTTVEENGIMMPVISFDIKYKKPVGYDEVLIIKTKVDPVFKLKVLFHFEMLNNDDNLVGKAQSEIVFVDSITRKPIRAPQWIVDAFLINKSNVFA